MGYERKWKEEPGQKKTKELLLVLQREMLDRMKEEGGNKEVPTEDEQQSLHLLR